PKHTVAGTTSPPPRQHDTTSVIKNYSCRGRRGQLFGDLPHPLSGPGSTSRFAFRTTDVSADRRTTLLEFRRAYVVQPLFEVAVERPAYCPAPSSDHAAAALVNHAPAE
ncbi:hypothetical protein, partial [Streptomyces murinus]|uniref:hypothetical protein n=1 Tax=Streptomyces murinus TaxID=33900 RepID=UPI003F47DAE6